MVEYYRKPHEREVLAFLSRNVMDQGWEITLPPHGTGNETYFAHSHGQSCFIKLGAHTDRYQIMSNLGLSPKIITSGQLEDGTTILVQQRIDGRKPSRKDFHLYLKKFAESIKRTHQCEDLKRILPKRSSPLYKDAGLEILGGIEQRWKIRASEVPAFAGYVDEKISSLRNQIDRFTGEGLVASHNDICNGNWLVTSDENLYLLDYESMALDDPALDLGAILWWYYPPELREGFLEIAGYGKDEGFRNRMRIRMAIHNLNIIIPREKSFDQFTPESFEEELVDFRAVMDGMENPQGYYD